MRISTNYSFQRGLDMMQRLQAALDRTQQQVSNGRRLLSLEHALPADVAQLDVLQRGLLEPLAVVVEVLLERVVMTGSQREAFAGSSRTSFTLACRVE